MEGLEPRQRASHPGAAQETARAPGNKGNVGVLEHIPSGRKSWAWAHKPGQPTLWLMHKGQRALPRWQAGSRTSDCMVTGAGGQGLIQKAQAFMEMPAGKIWFLNCHMLNIPLSISGDPRKVPSWLPFQRSFIFPYPNCAQAGLRCWDTDARTSVNRAGCPGLHQAK